MSASDATGMLRHLDSHLALALGTAQAGVWEYLPEQDLLRCCCNLHRILGEDCATTSYPLSSWQTRIHPDDRAAHAAAMAALQRGEHPRHTLEYRIRHASGNWIWVRDCGQRSHLADTGTELFHGILTDISAHYHDRQHIARQHRALALQAGIARKAVRASEEAQFLAELCQFFVTTGTYLDARFLSLQEAEAQPPAVHELRLPILVEGGLSLQLSLKYQPDNEPDTEEKTLLAELADEISLGIERLRARAAVAESEINLNKLWRALEQSPNSVLITDLQGRIEYVNRHFEKVSGYSAAESIGRNAEFLAGSNHDPMQAKTLWAAIAAGQTWEGEFRNQHKNGSNYISHAIISPIRQKDGSISHYLSIQEDVTERKAEQAELSRYRKELEQQVAQRTGQYLRAKEEAEAANRAKSAFLANMSHEIRTPLNAIIGLTHLLQRDLNTAPLDESETRLTRIDQAAQQLLQLLDDILELSRLEAGIVSSETQEFSPLALLQECRSQQLQQATGKGLAITVDHPLNLPARALSDTSSIRQILYQLLSNAIKFTQDGMVGLMVTQETDTSGRDFLRFSVSDTGPGISTAAQQRLFLPFEQGDPSLTRQHGGSGLGLVICRRLIELLHGEFGVDSTPGRGSTFWFTVPLHRPGTTAQTASASVPQNPGSEPLNTVPGLNAAAGLHAVRGKRAMYVRLLETFIQTHSGDFAQMRTLLATNQHEEARRLAHSIKGAAATLGANVVFESAAATDQAFRQGQPAEVVLQHIAQTETHYQALQDALRPILAQTREQLPATRLDPHALRQHLNGLSQLLHEGDFAVHQRLQKENDALQQLLGDKFLRFQQHIEHFDTGAAAALLDEALAAL